MRAFSVGFLFVASVAACDCGTSNLAAVACGDGTCGADESCSTCAKDCTCTAAQRCDAAQNRCVLKCGDGTCSGADEENCDTCSADCGCSEGSFCDRGSCAEYCGDGNCDDTRGENCSTCALDCGCLAIFECADNACRLRCGNGTCDVARGEGCSTCADDCACTGATACQANACASTCGNGTCDATEACDTCAADCGCTGASECRSGRCESTSTCSASVDCALDFAYSADLLVNAGTEDTVGAAVMADASKGDLIAGYGQGSNFGVAKLQNGRFNALAPVTTNGYFHGARHFVATASGTWVAAWDKTTGGSHSMFARSTDGGATWGAAAQLDVAGVTDNGGDVELMRDGNTIHAVYRGFVTGCSQSSCYEVFYTKSTTDGRTWSAPVRITNDRDQDDHVSVAADGNLVLVAWVTFDADLYVARSTNGGASFGSPQKMNDIAGKARAYAPGFIAVRGQRVHVVWADERDDSEGDIYMSTSTDGGVTWGADTKIHGSSSRWDQSPSVKIAPDGRAWVVWQRLVSGSGNEIFVTGTADGECFCKAVRLNQTTAEDQENPRFVIDSTGKLQAAWRHDNGNAWEIRYNAATPR